MAHMIKTRQEIEEEIRRRAQQMADAQGDGIVIHTPNIMPLLEPSDFGSHWSVDYIRQPGADFVEAAAIQIAAIWDMKDEGA